MLHFDLYDEVYKCHMASIMDNLSNVNSHRVALFYFDSKFIKLNGNSDFFFLILP